jgi:TonB family protein
MCTPRSLMTLMLTAWMASNGLSTPVLAQQASKASCHDEPVHDEDMQVTTFEEIRYPRLALAARVQGTVVVHLDLDGQGHVVAARAVSGPKLLLADALANARKWQFKANAVKAAVLLYEFRIEGQCRVDTNGLFAFQPPNRVQVLGCSTPPQP